MAPSHGWASAELRAQDLVVHERACPEFLPDELVVCILDFLDLHDLQAAAAVGRQFYNAAWRAGLYTERSYLPYSRLKDFESWVNTWTEVVKHAVRKDLRLALTFESPWLEDSEIDTNELSKLVDLLHTIQISMPVLVSLSITVVGSMFKHLCSALQHSAPRLRSFYLSTTEMNPLTPTTPPQHCITNEIRLFDGHAPHLRNLGLGCPIMDPHAIPVFSNVVRFQTYTWNDLTPLALSLHFPNLAHLYILFGSDEPEFPPPYFDLAGIALRSLVFKDTRYTRDSPPVRALLGSLDVPVLDSVCHAYEHLDWHHPLGWKGDSRDKINMRIDSLFVPSRILVSSPDATWTRSYSFVDPDSHDRIPICAMPGVCARLEYLRLHSDMVFGFLQCEAEFIALRRVRLDVYDEDGGRSFWHGPTRLFCDSHSRNVLDEEHRAGTTRIHSPNLAVLVLSPLRLPRRPSRGTLRLDLEDLAFLCRALGAPTKPALEMCEIAVSRSHSPWECPSPLASGASLDDFFSPVTCLPPGAEIPCAAFDSAVWDDTEAALRDQYLCQFLAS
ncbi:hypothetical protein AURDEDRAFT_155913 [Auricularia subglabra TFB-10046 SS5]|nr:hypothetical protein AURDEDRAFT_155913 [Auricularia subglabra TFB-10046 SS5]